VKVQLNAAANAALGQFPLTFTGKTKFQNKDFTFNAVPVTLTVALPFELKAEPLPLKIPAGTKAKLKVMALRKGTYKGPIALEVRNLPANVVAPKGTIAQDQPSAEIEVTAAANAAAGDKGDVNVLGTATGAGNQQAATPNFVVSVQPAPPPPVIAYELKVEGAPLKVAPGGKAKIKVTAVRKGFMGPITVELRNLPPKVTAAKAVIPMGQPSIEVEVVAAADAPPGDKADVQANGTAAAPADKAVASSNFTVSVQKP
jgi:hypothetical protein